MRAKMNITSAARANKRRMLASFDQMRWYDPASPNPRMMAALRFVALAVDQGAFAGLLPIRCALAFVDYLFDLASVRVLFGTPLLFGAFLWYIPTAVRA
jgi:hypothetical protein